MKIKIFSVISALLAASIMFTACGESKSDSESSSESESEAEATDESESEGEATEYVEESMEADPDAVPASGAAPVLSASDAQGSAGETVEVTISVSGADNLWAMCGVHVTYDDVLTCVASESDPDTPEYTKGDALNKIDAFVTLLQTGDNRNEYLLSNNLSAVFFVTSDSANDGTDGDIVTYQFTIPEDAQLGTEYEVGFYYRSGDMFTDIDADEAMTDYAFSHYETGTITVL
ncbi:MAG: hypothetical protein LUG26_01225 [Ruminococcus sp.]|nr:hypothetical protein [Ruminococcus sp.]